MAETDKPASVRAVPPAVPIPNVKVPDPPSGFGSKDQDPNDDGTGHEAFERAKAETRERE